MDILMSELDLVDQPVTVIRSDETLDIVSSGLDQFFNVWNVPSGPTSLLVRGCD